MKMLRDLIVLLILLAVLGVILYRNWPGQSGEERAKKYSHPITRPGGSW